MTQTSYSKDTLCNILVDKIIAPNPQDNVQVKKEKIVFGSDGSYTDVTTLSPFPVSLYGPFVPPALADTITATYPDSVTEVYVYRQGGLNGTILLTLTIVYTDSLKFNISSVVRT